MRIISLHLSLILFVAVFILSPFMAQTKYTILASPVSLGFDQYNVIKQIRIRFMPETSFLKQDKMLISFSSAIEITPGQLAFSLVDQFQQQLAKGVFTPISDASITANNLQYFQNGLGSSYTTDFSSSTWYLNINIIKSQWLTLILSIKRNLANTFSSDIGSISMAIISSIDPQHITYEWTNGMSYFYYASIHAVVPPQLITTQIANNLYAKTGQIISQVPGDIYPVYLQIVPTVNFTDFTLNLQFTSMTMANLLGLVTLPYVKDFQFQGTCYFICQAGISCITAQYCRVSSAKIEVKITQLIATKTYVLRLSVLNPPYQASKNLMLWVDSNGTVQDTATIISSLATTPITIFPSQMNLFWRIPYSIATGATMGLGIFVNGGINTIQIGFNITTASPFGEILELSVYVGSTQLIMQSINHNLPCVNTTVSYQYIFPNLIIRNITALTKTGYRYYIAFRTRYSSTDSLSSLGSVSINLKRYPTLLLFNPLVVNTPKTIIPYSDFHDYSGFHNITLFKNVDTQVVSAMDNVLQNGTSEAIRKYFSQAVTVGVDPEIANQQLLFFLKVPSSSITLGTLGQRYDTKVFFNPNIFQSVSNKGLQYVAYNSNTSKWDNFGNDCYTDQQPNLYITQKFMCQKWNDHVFTSQIDNTLNIQSYFSYYQNTCGSGNQVTCQSPSCLVSCTLFKGYVATTKGMGGIASIRNVTFIPNYQSPIIANDKNMDFIISFYHNGVFVSATLINAYTIKSLPLQRTTLSFINTYNDGMNYNKGDKIPTLIKITGRLELSEYIKLKYPQSMKLYLPSTKVSMVNFVSGVDSIGCSYYCRYNGSMSLGVSENWLQWQTVSIENMPQLTNDFKILVPIQLKSNLMSIYIGFVSQGQTVAIYRYGGSAVNQSISNIPINYLFTTQIYANPWNLVSPWVINPATYTYLQKINLQQTNSYNNFTLITMSGSIMPYHLTPYITFSIINMQILQPYTTITVGNSLQNRTCDKLNYFYNLKSIQCFICQLYTNDNTTTNNIVINYPLYNNDLGPGYPFDQVFNYAYASDGMQGGLEGIRSQTGDKVLVNSCQTNKATEYNVGEVGRQLEIYHVKIDPIFLSSTTYTSLQLILQIPSFNIKPVQCSIIDLIFFSNIACQVLSQSGNQTTLQISITPSSTVNLVQFYIYLNCIQVATVSLSTGQSYKLTIVYPHTDATGVLEVIYGSLFTPFSSLVYQCQNSFTYIVAAYNNTITINSNTLNTVGINMNSQLQFNLTLSQQKGDLLKNSYVEFAFTGLQVTQHTLCYLVQFQHLFWTTTWSAGSYRLYASAGVSGFTDNKITVKCSNLVLTAMSPTLIVRVFDITANTVILISSGGAPYVLTTTPYFTNPSPITSTGIITSKKYTTLGFNSFYTITYSISGAGLVEGIIDLSQYSIDYRLLRCQLSIAQDVFCRAISLSTNASLESRSRFIYFKTLFTSAFTSITISIYPVLQQKRTTPPIINTLIKVGTTNLYYISITDSLPTIPVTDVFLINSYQVYPIITNLSIAFAFEVTFTFNIAISMPLYLQINEIFFFTQIQGLATMSCTINNLTVVPCAIVEKNLIKLNSFAYTQNVSYTLRVQQLYANYQIPLKDRQNFFFRMFVTDSASQQINYVSYMNIDLSRASQLMSIINSYQNMFGRSYLIWNTTNAVTQVAYVPVIYVGYFGLPVDLIEYNSNRFVEDFVLSSTNYTLNNFTCSMGKTACPLTLVAVDNSTVSKYFTFTITSSYYNRPPILYVQVSTAKCVINAEFSNYKIYQNGITLPIILNFTLCKPLLMLTFVPTLNSTQVSIDSSLSELNVTFDNPIGIVFVRHSSSITTLKNYTLTLSLIGTYANSFTIPTTFTISKIATNSTNIMAVTPQILALQPTQLQVQIQCNEPSTVYWAVGFYPTTLGLKGQDIQTRLLNGQIGLWTSIRDVSYLNYGDLEYGLTYTEVPNVWKQLNIDQLIGNTTYSFKYFCVNLQGTFSDGKILTFTTPPSIYSMVKLQLGFSIPLSYTQANNFACAISQSLIIPYRESITSFDSNCKNASLIFFNTYSDMYWNFNISTSLTTQQYYYNFYINSFTMSAGDIAYLMRDLLRKNYRIQSSQLPLWIDFNIQQIEPNSINPIFSGDAVTSIDQTSISIMFPITNQLCYVVVGLLSSYFNNQTMSMPDSYMIKQGKFSENVEFNQVYMNYTTSDITLTFYGLNANTQYSIFYFVTVDDPRINSKHSNVQYINLVTDSYLQVDLFGTDLAQNAIYWIVVLFCTIFLSG